jgi:hypothetical protein
MTNQGNTRTIDPMFASYLGRPATVAALPDDFLFAMRETAAETLREWLQAAGVPAEAVTLLDSVSALATPACADADAVAQAAQAIAALGGAFNGASTMGISHVKERAQAWAAARS